MNDTNSVGICVLSIRNGGVIDAQARGRTCRLRMVYWQAKVVERPSACVVSQKSHDRDTKVMEPKGPREK